MRWFDYAIDALLAVGALAVIQRVAGNEPWYIHAALLGWAGYLSGKLGLFRE